MKMKLQYAYIYFTDTKAYSGKVLRVLCSLYLVYYSLYLDTPAPPFQAIEAAYSV